MCFIILLAASLMILKILETRPEVYSSELRGRQISLVLLIRKFNSNLFSFYNFQNQTYGSKVRLTRGLQLALRVKLDSVARNLKISKLWLSCQKKKCISCQNLKNPNFQPNFFVLRATGMANPKILLSHGVYQRGVRPQK